MEREVELKSVVDDLERCRRAVEDAGGRLVFEGRLEDRRYDTADRRLSLVDVVLRLRTYRSATAVRAALDWKGPTMLADGYKVRDELSTGIEDPDTLARMLELLGYQVAREIDRDIVQYRLEDAIVRFESYPRMDVLVEVEGEPAGIEAAIRVLGLPRDGFTTERLQAFAMRYTARTGQLAAVSDRELRGEAFWKPEDP
ncbi:MAG: class IV adenylate cyclase [Gemmatimonadaceae bacterium]|nr:class IV adenylate cyclase [Gemmatimonadaceae bacterium]